jgi:undecaprenyl-diphosphatase
MVEWRLSAASEMQAPLRPAFPARSMSTVLIVAGLVFYIHSGLNYQPTIKTGIKTERFIRTDVADSFDIYHLPRFTESITGVQQQPLNIILVAKNVVTLTYVFTTAGWQSADQVNLDRVARTLKALLGNESYPTAPLTPLFWNGTINDLGFEKPTPENTVQRRHHVRLWKTDLVTTDNRCVYVGTIGMDTGIKWGLIHKIKPNLDSEREAFKDDLLAGGRVTAYRKIALVSPLSGINFVGDSFFTDGYLYVLDVD